MVEDTTQIRMDADSAAANVDRLMRELTAAEAEYAASIEELDCHVDEGYKLLPTHSTSSSCFSI
jgi:hypothetical protein